MLLFHHGEKYLIYGKHKDGYGYRGIVQGKYYCERIMCIFNSISIIGKTIDMLNNTRAVSVIYITNNYKIVERSYVFDRIENRYVTQMQIGCIPHWRDLSPTTLSLIRCQYEIIDWHTYIESFAAAWNMFPSFIASRMRRRAS